MLVGATLRRLVSRNALTAKPTHLQARVLNSLRAGQRRGLQASALTFLNPQAFRRLRFRALSGGSAP
jgi:hypothetical protein